MIPVTLSGDTGYGSQQVLGATVFTTLVQSQGTLIEPPERHVAGPDLDRHREWVATMPHPL
jgi:hypothetical protein